MKKKLLNLYCGIGGNRKEWGDSYEVTAVEYNPEIAKIYSDFFPNDIIIVGDAHEYLLKNYMNYDFIWSSPPCQSHSDIRRMGAVAGLYDAKFPDLNLWQEIIFLKHFFKGKYVVENVKPYYEPFVPPTKKLDRHLIWANFNIKDFQSNEKFGIRKKGSKGFGFDISGYKIKHRKDQIIRNLVNPKLGKHIFDCYLQSINPLVKIKANKGEQLTAF